MRKIIGARLRIIFILFSFCFSKFRFSGLVLRARRVAPLGRVLVGLGGGGVALVVWWLCCGVVLLTGRHCRESPCGVLRAGLGRIALHSGDCAALQCRVVNVVL